MILTGNAEFTMNSVCRGNGILAALGKHSKGHQRTLAKPFPNDLTYFGVKSSYVKITVKR
jgi:hypothetical protein